MMAYAGVLVARSPLRNTKKKRVTMGGSGPVVLLGLIWQRESWALYLRLSSFQLTAAVIDVPAAAAIFARKS